MAIVTALSTVAATTIFSFIGAEAMNGIEHRLDKKIHSKIAEHSHDGRFKQILLAIDQLTLAQLTGQIDTLEDEIATMEKDKASGNWRPRDEAALREKRRALSDRNLQRKRLFESVINRKQ